MNWTNSNQIISPDWLARPSALVAPDLLGCYLVRQFAEGQVLQGRIVETEAYALGDPAFHAYRRRTPRNEVLFGAAGLAYVYLTYGLHHCFNIVTDLPEVPSGVLIRALELIEVPSWLPENILNPPGRITKNKIEKLAAGPGKLCRVMAIDRTLNGTDLTQPPLWLEQGDPVSQIIQTTRIGISQGVEIPWRWYVENCPAVSVLRSKPLS